MKLKELPEMERPYEKLETYGAEILSMAELIAIVIKSGTKDLTSVEIAQELLKDDIFEKGITFIKDISIEELKSKRGIGRVKAIQLKAIAELASRANKPSRIIRKEIYTPEDVAKLMMSDLRNENKEIIKTILLDIKNKLIKVVTNAVGGTNSSYIEIKDIFREPIKSNASKIILVHNHPSGDVTPSISDIKITKKVFETGLTLGIELIDHIIIGDGKFSSLKRLKKFW